jgi:hypothetical protein
MVTSTHMNAETVALLLKFRLKSKQKYDLIEERAIGEQKRAGYRRVSHPEVPYSRIQ